VAHPGLSPTESDQLGALKEIASRAQSSIRKDTNSRDLVESRYWRSNYFFRNVS